MLLIFTCAVLFGSAGYFLGARNHGNVYEISGGSSSLSYEVSTELSESPEGSESSEVSESPEVSETPKVSETLEETSVKINLNTATVEELMELPGIGEVKAAAIVAYREEYGPFQTPEDLLLVSGIGEATLDQLIDLVTVEESN